MKSVKGVSRPTSPVVNDFVCHGESFLSEIQKDFKFWLCIVLFFGLFRSLLIFQFSDHLSARAGAWQITRAFWAGARFDAAVAAYWILPLILLTLANCLQLNKLRAPRVRRSLLFLFLLCSLSLCIVNAGYISEYKSNFDQTIYGLVYDDQGAIFKTIWQEYPVLPLLLLVAVGTAGAGWALARFLGSPFAEPQPSFNPSQTWRRGAALLIALVWFTLARGSLGSAPWKYNDAFKATTDDFLNKMVLNPYVALKYAIQRHGLFGQPNAWKTILPDENIREGATELFPLARFDDSLDHCLEKTAPGNPASPPKHIFLIIMESYDAWTMLPAYRSLGISPELSRLASNGIFVKAFVPAGNMTMVSLDTILSGLPGAGLRQSYQVSALHAFPTAPAAIFKRLGYTTRFIKGGDPSWNRLGDFARDQGFDEVHSAKMMPVAGKARNWGWGVDDEDMFGYALSLLSDDKPSFNVIMSVSNHQPHNLDVYGMGYPHREIPPELAAAYSGKLSMPAIGHYWYADRALGRFVSAVMKKTPRSLFAITGDHWSRNFLNDHPTIYESTAVPFVLYGPEILAHIQTPPQLAGSHIDIAPTLIDLAAPAGFKYRSFGGNMLDRRREPVGMGQFAVVTPECIFPACQPDEAQTLEGKSLACLPARDAGPDCLPSRNDGRQFANGAHQAFSASRAPSLEYLDAISHSQRIQTALGWWRLVEGGTLPANPNVTAFHSPPTTLATW